MLVSSSVKSWGGFFTSKQAINNCGRQPRQEQQEQQQHPKEVFSSSLSSSLLPRCWSNDFYFYNPHHFDCCYCWTTVHPPISSVTPISSMTYILLTQVLILKYVLHLRPHESSLIIISSLLWVGSKEKMMMKNNKSNSNNDIIIMSQEYSLFIVNVTTVTSIPTSYLTSMTIHI